MRFFIDNCISVNLAEGIKAMESPRGIVVEHLTEYFEEGTPDTEWIPVLAADGDWVVVSGDPKITRSKAERAVWMESGLTGFFFANRLSEKRFWVQAGILVHWWPIIVDTARAAPSGSGFLVPLQGRQMKTAY